MTQVIPEPPGAGPRETPPDRAPRSRWQVGLRGLMLFTAAFAVWTTYLLNRHHNASLAARIPAMRPFAHELVVADETKAAVVKLEELWPDDDRWDVYLPPGQYRLCLATRGIGYNGVPPAETSQPIQPGRHTIELAIRKTKSGWRVEASSDGARLLTVDETPEWNPIKTFSADGDFSKSTTLPAGELIVLQGGGFGSMQNGPASEPIYFLHAGGGSLRGGEVVALSPGGPYEGIRLWIEPVAGSSGRRPPPRFLRG
jgi:hypothetical protein